MFLKKLQNMGQVLLIFLKFVVCYHSCLGGTIYWSAPILFIFFFCLFVGFFVVIV